MPMLSFGSGGVPGACCQRTSPVTVYVPLPVEAPALSNVSQVPPPVVALVLPLPPAGATNVPEPVRVIFEQSVDPGGTQSLALAEAMPPAERVPVAKSTLMLSDRTLAAFPCTAGRPTVIDDKTANGTTAIHHIHVTAIFIFVLLSSS